MTIQTRDHFTKQICEYLAANTGGVFTFGTGNTNLEIGDITKGTNGVYVAEAPTPPPDPYTATDYFTIDFMSIDQSSQTAYEKAQYVYELFHQNHHWTTSSYLVYFSKALGQIEDMDRNSENQKMYRVTILFTTRSLIS